MLIARLLLCSLPLALAMPFCHAQETPKTSLQFLAFPKQIRPEPVELVVGEGKTIEVQTPGNELSISYQVPSLQSIVVGKTILDAEGKAKFEAYGQVKSLGTPTQIILMLRKGNENKDGFVLIPINGDLGEFGGGSFLFINASALHVGGVIGDSKFALKPGQRRMLKPKPDFDDDICQVTLAYQKDDEAEEQWKTFKDTRWSANEAYRSLVFFYQHPETGRLGVAPIVDILPYPTAGAN
jgi:hypothetical protein